MVVVSTFELLAIVAITITSSSSLLVLVISSPSIDAGSVMLLFNISTNNSIKQSVSNCVHTNDTRVPSFENI